MIKRRYLAPDFKPKISPMLLSRRISETEMLQHISKNELYGFAVVDIIARPEAEKFLAVNWPPILRKADIDYKDLPLWMQHNTSDKTFPRKTIIQSMFGEKVLLHTELIKFYLENGFTVTKIHKLYEYEGRRCFKKVYDVVYNARVEATVDDDTMKATAVKLVSNSMYGQMLMVILKYIILNT